MIGDWYPTWHPPITQVKGLVRSYPGSATGARRRVAPPQHQQQHQQQSQTTTTASSTTTGGSGSSSDKGGKAVSASSGGGRGRDKADGGASLSATVGMQVRPLCNVNCGVVLAFGGAGAGASRLTPANQRRMS